MTLSDKKVHWMEEENWDEDWNPISFKGIDGFKIDDVKEFIKEILEEIEKINKESVGYDENYPDKLFLDKVDLKQIIKQKAGELGE